MKITSFFSLLWTKILICCVTILITLTSPLLVITFLPIFIVRKLVSNLSTIWRPDLGKMLNALSCIFACDDLTTNPKWTILQFFNIKGSVDINMLKSKLIEKVIGVRKVGNDLKNIELKGYPYKWMGFIFWKWDKNFDISNHVRYYDDKATEEKSKISLERLNEIKHELLFLPYQEKRSPWEIIIIPNIQSDNVGEETIITFRFHHSVGDGFSLLKLICFEIMDGAPKEFAHNIVCPKLGVFQIILNCLKLVKLPFELAECVVESFGPNDWKITESERSKNYFEVFAPKISLLFIKDLNKELNTSMNSVILSAITAGIRQSMLKHNGKVPHHIHIGLPFPREGHPDKLRNFCSGIFIKLPTGENDPFKRLRKIERSLENLKNSTIPITSLIFSTSVGCMFHWMIRPVAKMTIFSPMTAIGSLFPGPKGKLTIFGQENVDCNYSLGSYFGNFGITFNTVSFSDHLNLRFMVNSNILSKKRDVQELVSNILQEFQVLKKFANEIV